MVYPNQPKKDLKIYRADINHIPVLVNHHRLMFEDIIVSENVKYDICNWDDMEMSYREKLQRQLLSEDCIAFILMFEDKIVASGAVSIMELVPLPNETNCKIGYIHSIYTEKEHRRKGYGKIIMEELVNACKERAIKRFLLKSSKAGVELYQKLGFAENTYMSLSIN